MVGAYTDFVSLIPTINVFSIFFLFNRQRNRLKLSKLFMSVHIHNKTENYSFIKIVSFPLSRVSQPWHYGKFGLDNSLCGAALCVIVG